ncbi:MAG: hypothetical protein KDB21_08950 [Acidimicrobiales bacterium]|nr:hypothetical protein [Acidimicrobiales bacterium]
MVPLGRGEQRWVYAGVAVVVGLVIGWGAFIWRDTNSWHDTPVGLATLVDERTLAVGIGCYSQWRASAEEYDDRVVLDVEVFGLSEGDCGGSGTVTLEAPLGDRVLIHAGTGEVIEVEGS